MDRYYTRDENGRVTGGHALAESAEYSPEFAACVLKAFTRCSTINKMHHSMHLFEPEPEPTVLDICNMDPSSDEDLQLLAE